MIEIVNIEKKTYEKFVGQFESFVKKMTEMGNRGTNKCLGDWLDNDEVCRNLKISKRTLQTLRDNGTLAYSQISHKTYYKQEDVDKVIKDVRDRQKGAAWRKPRKKSETKRDCVTPKKSMKDIESLFDKVTSNYRPLLNGERYLSDVEVSHRLKVSRRTLQDYRDNGTLPYFKLGGKVLYRESDLEALLQRCYHPVISKAVSQKFTL